MFYRIFLIPFIFMNGVQAGDTLRFLPQWTVQAQFAGFYMAEERGFYREAGLTVEILDGGPQMPAGKALTEGSADIISSFLSTGLAMAEQGRGIVNVCQYSKRSALMLVSKKDRFGADIENLRNRRIGLWHSDFREMPLYFMKDRGLEPQVIPVLNGIQLFLNDGIDGLVCMEYNEYHRLLETGLGRKDLNCYYLREAGLDMPEDGLYCREEFYQSREAEVAAFVEASLRGWQYAFSHEDETVDVIVKMQRSRGLRANRSHERNMLRVMKEIFVPGSDGSITGEMDEESFRRVCVMARRAGIISQDPVYNDFMKGGR